MPPVRWAVLLVLASLAACAPVKAWERGLLAHPSMKPGAAQSAFSDEFVTHVYDVREGASPCSGRAGGGCGCN